MRLIFTLLLLSIIFTTGIKAQSTVDKVQFFNDTSVINATLTTNLTKLLNNREKEGYKLPATFTCRLADGTNVNDEMSIETRGKYRRGFCYIPPLKLSFNVNANAAMYQLHSLKLVSMCKTADIYGQYLLKEYIVYKLYNIITDKSFHVRLLNLNIADSSGKKKPITEYAFLIEDIKEMAKRNSCTEFKNDNLITEATSRRQMTIVGVFEYMIGNTDWAVPGGHNTKLILDKSDSTARPYVVPYDFDFSGLVGTDYSAPDERLGIEDVKQRLYRGFIRTMGEMNEVLQLFRKKKDEMYATISNFALLSDYSKKQMIDYLDEFFESMENPAIVKDVFITSARKD